jgi:transposase
MNGMKLSGMRSSVNLKLRFDHQRDYLIVGIDVAKDRHHAFFGTASGRTLLRRLLFDNNQAGFKQLITRTHSFSLSMD